MMEYLKYIKGLYFHKNIRHSNSAISCFPVYRKIHKVMFNERAGCTVCEKLYTYLRKKIIERKYNYKSIVVELQDFSFILLYHKHFTMNMYCFYNQRKKFNKRKYLIVPVFRF